MNVSVVICTHNRADDLARALDSVLAQAGDLPCEVVVVDNRSTDATPDVVRRAAERGPVRYLYEPQLGLCHARNAGWRAARGTWVAYLDDDAVAEPGWLAAIPAAFAIAPNVGVAGGRVSPDWRAARPAWLSDEIARSLTVVDWAAEPKVIADVRREWLVGANLALPRSVLAEVGGFRPELDRVGTRLLSGGDVYLQKQVIRRGYTCVYYPAMAVRHLVPASRLDQRWFRRRYFWQGVSDAVMELLDERKSPGARLATGLARSARLARHPRRIRHLLARAEDPQRFTEQCFTWIAVGHVAGLLGAARR